MSLKSLVLQSVSCLTLLAMLAESDACSSTNVPACQNPSAATSACNACAGSSCGSQVSAVGSDCPEYVSCFEACDCSDAACISACSTDVSSNASCSSASSALALCVELNCPPDECAPRESSPGTCLAGTVLCNGLCVDPNTDSSNCGGCGMPCPSGGQCASGVCACLYSSATLCGEACVYEASDSENCGGCGIHCNAPETCLGGRCECATGTLCDGACVDETNDTENCGACGTRCPAALAGGPITCSAGACVCPPMRTLCGGAYCVNEETDPLNCGACGAKCPATAPECSRGACIPTPIPNCMPGGPGLSDCGANSESCCTSLDVTGGTFSRTYDPSVPDAGIVTGPDGSAVGQGDPATVSTVSIDKYVVTVGRFRQFVNAWNAYTGYYPAAGSGVHAHLHGGKGLVALAPSATTDGGTTDGGVLDATIPDSGMDAADSAGGLSYEPGWVTTDNANVAPTDRNLACNAHFATWTPTASTHENLPITCVTWQEAYAFCIWDGGFLPSEAEWEYAAAGGSLDLEFPWGSAPAGTSSQYAIYGDGAGHCFYPGGTLAPCTGVDNIAPVGSATLGAGFWGQLDLSGNVQQWVLDQFAPYVDPSVDGAFLAAAPTRSIRGGNFGASILTPSNRANAAPVHRLAWVGFRCARMP